MTRVGLGGRAIPATAPDTAQLSGIHVVTFITDGRHEADLGLRRDFSAAGRTSIRHPLDSASVQLRLGV